MLRSRNVHVAALAIASGLLAIASTSHAQDHEHRDPNAGRIEQLQRMVQPPSGWQMDADLSADRARALSTYPHFGGLHTLTSAEVWVPNGANKSVVMVVSRVVATDALTTPDALHAALHAAGAEFENSVASTLDVRAEAMPATPRQFPHSDTATEIRIDFADVAHGYAARMVLAHDPASLEAVTVECIWNGDNPAAQACRAALPTANATLVLSKRLPITWPAAAPAPSGSNSEAPSMSPGPSMSLSDGGKIVFPPLRLPPPAAPFNWRPYVFGVGLAVMLLAFYLNHRHRKRLEALDGRPIRRRRGSSAVATPTDSVTADTVDTVAASDDNARTDA